MIGAVDFAEKTYGYVQHPTLESAVKLESYFDMRKVSVVCDGS